MALQAAESIMPQTNAAREPSMEEILASIRRIIEDSDTARKVADADIPPAAHDPAASDVNQFRNELHSAPSDTLRAGPRFLAMPERVTSSPAFPERPAAPPQAAAEPVHDEVDMEDGLLMDDEFDAAETAPSFAPPAENHNPKQAIISDVASRQVAASFGELSEAFAATRRKSFDEVAEEMMRPMLQDWLDNNLPTLVERLVREEIERVARGPVR